MLQKILHTIEAFTAFAVAMAMVVACMPLWPVFALATLLWLTDRKSSPLFPSYTTTPR